MGERIQLLYKHIKKEYKVAFYATFLIALLIHLYKFTNTLPNHDSIFNYYADQNVLGSGRWALSAACGISSYYDLPWVIGVLSCVYIALTTAVITAIFRVKNPVVIGVTGALLAASPAVTETFFFQYTADGYMLAMLLTAAAVYFSRMEERRLFRWGLSGLLICISCGIYQAYVSFGLLLSVFYFMMVLLEGGYDKKACFKWVGCQWALYTCALGAYYGIWQFCMHITGTVANSYQGISEVGTISVQLFVNGARDAIVSVSRFFLQGDVLWHGFSLYSVLNLLFLGVMGIGIVMASFRSGIFQKKWAVLLLALCLLAIVPFACIWHLTSETVSYRAMMLQSLTLFYVVTALLYEKWAKTLLKDGVCLLLIVIVLNNAMIANICYFYMNLSYERSYADGLEMVIEIHDMQDEYEFDKLAVVGTRSYDDLKFRIFHEDALESISSFRIVGNMLDNTLLYESSRTGRFLRAVFGVDLTSLSRDQCKGIADLPEVREMPCWPADGSMTVVDDVLVIKFSD